MTQSPGWHKRQRIWRHNGFFGSVRMAEMNMRSIVSSETATDEAKHTANYIIGLLFTLRVQLKERIDRPPERS